MPPAGRTVVSALAFALVLIFLLRGRPSHGAAGTAVYRPPPPDVSGADRHGVRWGQRSEDYPVEAYRRLPGPSRHALPAVQFGFGPENATAAATRRQRRAQVKAAMRRSWEAYRHRAWMTDELAPVSGGNRTTSGGWAATLVGSLDTLWIMDMRAEFTEAVEAIVRVDFTSPATDTIRLLEATTRYMGGFISAYDLSGDTRLLDKALELADMLYAAFDTPNRVPVARWDFRAAARGEKQLASNHTTLAEIGSLCLELTRLSQITNNHKWYDAVARITDLFDEQQGLSQLPGMWPLIVNGQQACFHAGDTFGLAAGSDSMYEYLLKMHALLGGSEQYARMYRWAMDSATRYMLYSPMVKATNHSILVPGMVNVRDGAYTLQPELQHQVCFAGGLLALGGKLMENDTHVDFGRRVTEACIWAYGHFKLGIMPERCNVIPCEGLGQDPCPWDTPTWHEAIVEDAFLTDDRGKNATTLIEQLGLPDGVSAIRDGMYHLRPEAVESVFVLYRTTGDSSLQDAGWKMFRSIYSQTRSAHAHAAIADVTNGTAPLMDNMESLWTAETLKYFFLLYSDPEYLSLDEWVFNTEAHPFKRPGNAVVKSAWFSGWRRR